MPGGLSGRPGEIVGCLSESRRGDCNAQRVACVLRGTTLNDRQRAMLRLALSFFTWRTLVAEAGLSQAEAVKTMVQAIMSARET